ncbi:MAG TPA: endonuclease/exonuclease/phosphatase family protein [Bacteroidales bacterium]|nr:endonuclease/exonuclease/phosphatase family protein [Bacteroidales bacterium]
MFKKLIHLSIIILISITLNAQDKKLNIAVVAFYNVENLYDTIDDPKTDDAEFLPTGIQNWNTAKYSLKLQRISEVISKIGQEVVPGGPVIIGLSEIENRYVLEDLTNSEPLKNQNYGIVQYNSPDRRGVDVALLYQKKRFTLEGSKPFTLKSSDTSLRTRDQLLVWGKLDGEEMYFLVNHWPSRRGGEQRSAPKRKDAALLSKQISDSLFKMNPNVKLIIMGDLNDNPNNASIAKHLNAKGEINKITQGDLYNPMFGLFQDGIGSYAYRDSWDLYDQMILTSAFLGTDRNSYKLLKAKIFNEQFLKQKTGTFSGYPWRTAAGGQYLMGYSDHFPIYVILGRETK